VKARRVRRRSWLFAAAGPTSVGLAMVISGCMTSESAPALEAPEFAAWPLGPDGDVPRSLYSTHGQYWKTGPKPHLHEGVDISACPREPVFAVEDGTVVYSKFSPSNYQYQELIVSRGDDLTQGVRYLHLGTSLVDVGEPVKRDELIGTVVNWDVYCSYDHLHLQRVFPALAAVGGVWPIGLGGDSGNPLALFDPSVDGQSPWLNDLVASASDRPTKLLYFDDDSYTEQLPDSLSGEIDVVASIHDRCFKDYPCVCSGPGMCTEPVSDEVAPYEATLTILGPLAGSSPEASSRKVFATVRFEDALPPDPSGTVAEEFYHLSGKGDYGARDLRLLLTHGDPAVEDAWKPKQGKYEVTVEFKDRAGNTRRHSQTVTVSATPAPH
jgi:hypothetical protein